MFGDSLLEVLNRYAREFDYETLFVSVPSMYNWLRRIAKGIAPKYGETPAVKYWLEETVQRALDEYCKYTKVDEKMQQELAGIASVKRFV